MKKIIKLLIFLVVIMGLNYFAFAKEPKDKIKVEGKEKKVGGKNNQNTFELSELIGQGILGNLTDKSVSINVLAEKGM